MTEDPYGPHTIVAIRDGNVAVFRQVFDACYESLCRYAFTVLRDADEAEDVVQHMFMKLWERKEELNITSALRSYLFKSVYNQCLNQLEHRSVKSKFQQYKLTLTEAIQQPEVFGDEVDAKIKTAIEALPPQCRTIFLMSRYEEMRHTEIAEKLNISVNTIQNQICKALKILREELKEIV
jgi:RNA polymerase sigma-70 factor (ECF subfamily)